jgi:hypothetical protein
MLGYAKPTSYKRTTYVAQARTSSSGAAKSQRSATLTHFTHRECSAAIQVDERNVPYSMASSAYVVPFNLMGHPAVVIPVG